MERASISPMLSAQAYYQLCIQAKLGNNNLLFRVIHTMTFSSRISADICFEMLPKTTFYLTSFRTLYFDSLSDIYSDILFGILSDIYSGTLSDILSGISSDILSGILFDLSSGFFVDRSDPGLAVRVRRGPLRSSACT